jgi:hypothetical protein
MIGRITTLFLLVIAFDRAQVQLIDKITDEILPAKTGIPRP